MEEGGGARHQVPTVCSNVDAPATPNTELKKLLDFKVYKRRWFILLVLCLLNCSNAMIWLTFAPVADKSAKFLKVSLSEVNWLSLVFMVVAIPFSFVTTWMVDTIGLRTSLILGSWLNMFGALVRFGGSMLSQESAVYPVVMLGQTLGALAQPLIFFTPTKLAALWFPDHQRATANMIASMSNPLGLLLDNLISPLVAKTPAQIPVLLLVYAAPTCIICFLATVGIRSSSPPTPPSASAETSEPFLQGLKLLLKNKAYLVLMMCFGLGIAVLTCFSSLLQQILCVQGYDNSFAGLCGALFIVFGIIGAAALGLYVDKTKKFMEAIKINMTFATLACIAFSLVALIRDQKVAVVIICSVFGFFGFSIYPVALELAVECSYPVGEATVAGLIFIMGQVQSVLLMIVFQALTKRIADSPLSTCGSAVLSWKVPMMLMAGLTTLFTCCFIIFFHTRYRRLEAEQQATYGTKQSNGTTTTEKAPSVEE
ncbi:solute carrier family 49 member A3 [Dicentrarchus labrax]|uniref:Solute carrier family 49 member 3 n=1 Tax=Dicentrarchus labrax TaxID=13489 RepID=A0A8C4EI77_DICLA|nr:solute carrier family 49 member A3 [Dicentrarchus labrax]